MGIEQGREAVGAFLFGGEGNEGRELPRPAFSENNAPVFFACDANYFPYALVAAASIVDNGTADHNYDVIILCDGPTPGQIAAFESWKIDKPNCAIRIFDIKRFLKHGCVQLHVDGHVSEAAYYRIFAPSLFLHYDKILYLDSDLVLLGDVAPLLAERLGENLLGACCDYNVSQSCLRNFEDCRYIHTLGVVPDEYFNSGVLLLNLRMMREENTEEKILSVMRGTPKPRWHDQDILNKALKGRVCFLDSRWNFHEWMLDPEEGSQQWLHASEEFKKCVRNKREDVRVLHYITAVKPWSWNYFGGCDSFFWKYAGQTPLFEDISTLCSAKRTKIRLLRELVKTLIGVLKYRVKSIFPRWSGKENQCKLESRRKKLCCILKELL